MGAWIETAWTVDCYQRMASLPSWERGLKPEDQVSVWDPV